jgi:hypothetical protein
LHSFAPEDDKALRLQEILLMRDYRMVHDAAKEFAKKRQRDGSSLIDRTTTPS